MTGQEFGFWKVMYKSGSEHSGAIWRCRCKCGVEKDVRGADLRNGHSTSCGCNWKNLFSAKRKKFNNYDLSGTYGIGFTLKGKEFYFDLEDYEKIKSYCWCISNGGYITSRNDDGKTILLHKLILDDMDNNFDVDHIGHNKRDCRKANLRFVTRSQNNRNKSIQRNNTSGVPGVQWHTRDSVWEVYITYDHKKRYMGRFKDFNKAVEYRKELEDKHYGDYSYDNSMKLVANI